MLFIYIFASLFLLYVVILLDGLGLIHRLRLAASRISLEQIARRSAARYGKSPLFTCDSPIAWADDGDNLSWPAIRIDTVCRTVAAGLIDMAGVRYNDRVAILKRNHFDIHLLCHAVIQAGGVACPMNEKFASEKVAAYLTNIGAEVLITDSETARRLAAECATLGPVRLVLVTDQHQSAKEVLPGNYTDLLGAPSIALHSLGVSSPLARPVERGATDPCYLVHSSGTTGFPKAVILRNGPQARAVRAWLLYVHVSRRRDKGYMAVPHNHQAILLSFNAALTAGVRCHWVSGYTRGCVNPVQTLDELAAGKFTGFFAFPVIYTELKEYLPQRRDLSAMRVWASTGDAAHEVIIRSCVGVGSAFRRFLLPVSGSVYLDAQGSSEVGTPSVLRYYTTRTRHFDRCVGRRHSAPLGPKVRITRDGTPVSSGKVGRLEVKGTTIFEGYWNNHDLTYATRGDGWFFTGDVARWSKSGHVVQLDREVDVIRTRHGDVYSLPIEETVHRHPAIFDTCVFGARQSDGTQLPAAAVALRTGCQISEAQLLVELNQLLDFTTQLASVSIIPWHEFPLGVTGKTLKRVFRERTEFAPVPEANRPLVIDAPRPY